MSMRAWIPDTRSATKEKTPVEPQRDLIRPFGSEPYTTSKFTYIVVCLQETNVMRRWMKMTAPKYQEDSGDLECPGGIGGDDFSGY
jgi:hypothetical protein